MTPLTASAFNRLDLYATSPVPLRWTRLFFHGVDRKTVASTQWSIYIPEKIGVRHRFLVDLWPVMVFIIQILQFNMVTYSGGDFF